MKYLLHFSRLFVGNLFIFSGVVKANDPLGFSYKLEEYFHEFGMHWSFLDDILVPLAAILCIVEIILGVAVLVGYKMKLVSWSLLLMIVFFTILTGASAIFEIVRSCGCFGDAIKLTPWETFWKNVILIGLIALLLVRVKDIKEVLSKKITMAITLIALISFSYITYHVLNHLPIIDFRAYAIGKNIPEGMEYKDDGEIPPVHDFMLEDTQNDLAPLILKMDKVMLVIVYNRDKSDEEGFKAIKKVTDEAIKNGYNVYGVSASFEDDLILIQNNYDLPFNFLFCDETTLKTMIRANPGVMTLSKGTVTGKWNWNDTADIKL